jgi:hypothetical protein
VTDYGSNLELFHTRAELDAMQQRRLEERKVFEGVTGRVRVEAL